MRRLIKRIGQSEAMRGLLCWLAAQFIRVVRASGPWRILGREHIEQFLAPKRPFILAFWHGRLLMAPCAWPRDRTIKMLISTHRDGELIARTVAHFGIETVRGSKSKGGSAALRTMMKALEAGDDVGITPDGPRGPRMRAQPGAIALASLSGAPIVPLTFSTSRRHVISSWDRFLVALPFGRGVLLWGEPLYVPRDADKGTRETLRLELERRMNTLAAEADRLVGHTPIEPEVTA